MISRFALNTTNRLRPHNYQMFQNFRVGTARISVRLFSSRYNENHGEFESILDFFDEDGDGLLQFPEFEELTESLNVGEAHIMKVQAKYFPTKKEELDMQIFGELFEMLVDTNDDHMLQ